MAEADGVAGGAGGPCEGVLDDGDGAAEAEGNGAAEGELGGLGEAGKGVRGAGVAEEDGAVVRGQDPDDAGAGASGDDDERRALRWCVAGGAHGGEGIGEGFVGGAVAFDGDALREGTSGVEGGFAGGVAGCEQFAAAGGDHDAGAGAVRGDAVGELLFDALPCVGAEDSDGSGRVFLCVVPCVAGGGAGFEDGELLAWGVGEFCRGVDVAAGALEGEEERSVGMLEGGESALAELNAAEAVGGAWGAAGWGEGGGGEGKP